MKTLLRYLCIRVFDIDPVEARILLFSVKAYLRWSYEPNLLNADQVLSFRRMADTYLQRMYRSARKLDHRWADSDDAYHSAYPGEYKTVFKKLAA